MILSSVCVCEQDKIRYLVFSVFKWQGQLLDYNATNKKKNNKKTTAREGRTFSDVQKDDAQWQEGSFSLKICPVG